MRLRRGKGKGTLAVLCGLLLISGGLRLASVPGEALAAETADMPELDGSMVAAEQCTIEGAPSELAAALSARERRVEDLEARIEDRFRALAIAEEELTARLAELRAAEASLEETISGAEAASNTDLARLTSVYENMKPADAAALFEEMTPNFAAGFVGAMRPDAAAAVMAGLDPTTAYAISVILAGRNADVPTE